MSYEKPQFPTEITIDLSEINTEQALYLLTFLKGKNRTALHMYFKNTLLTFRYITNEKQRNSLIEAHPYLMKLRHLADKFNQRDGWWLEDQCLITHDKIPHNNLVTVIVVIKGEIKIIARKSKKKYFLEFMKDGKYNGNAEYFIETYKEDILKAAPFLLP